MSSEEFEEIVFGLTDEDLANPDTTNGTPLDDETGEAMSSDRFRPTQPGGVFGTGLFEGLDVTLIPIAPGTYTVSVDGGFSEIGTVEDPDKAFILNLRNLGS